MLHSSMIKRWFVYVVESNGQLLWFKVCDLVDDYLKDLAVIRVALTTIWIDAPRISL